MKENVSGCFFSEHSVQKADDHSVSLVRVPFREKHVQCRVLLKRNAMHYAMQIIAVKTLKLEY